MSIEWSRIEFTPLPQQVAEKILKTLHAAILAENSARTEALVEEIEELMQYIYNVYATAAKHKAAPHESISERRRDGNRKEILGARFVVHDFLDHALSVLEED